METSEKNTQCTGRLVVGTLLIHGVLVALLIWLFVYYAPSVGDRLASAGHLAAPTRIFFSIQGFVYPYYPFFPFLLPVALALPWLDARVLLGITRQRGSIVGRFWSGGIALALALFAGVSLWALHAPGSF